MTPVSPDDHKIRVPPRRVVDDHAAHALAILFEQRSLDDESDLTGERISPLQHSESGLAPDLLQRLEIGAHLRVPALRVRVG
jgi:hypothetical protein